MNELAAIVKARLWLQSWSPEEMRTLRERTGVSVADVALACGVTTQAVRQWESRARKPDKEHVVVYADVVRMLADELDDHLFDTGQVTRGPNAW